MDSYLWLSLDVAAVDLLPPYVISLMILGIRLKRTATLEPPSWLAERRLQPSQWTTLPFMVWALTVNRYMWFVADTHVSVYPDQLHFSMAEAALRILSVGPLLLFEYLGGRARRDLYLPVLIVTVVILTVVMDWLLNEIGWWAFILREQQFD